MKFHFYEPTLEELENEEAKDRARILLDHELGVKPLFWYDEELYTFENDKDRLGFEKMLKLGATEDEAYWEIYQINVHDELDHEI